MTLRTSNLPMLCVEGADDISAIAALLKSHGVDTRQGNNHLFIRSYGNVHELLSALPDQVKSERSHPLGFVLDIDIECTNRWQAVKDQLAFNGDPTTTLEKSVPSICPVGGYIGRIKGYPHEFGIWLMPDCKSDHQKLENLLTTLIPAQDPLWEHSRASTKLASELVDKSNLDAADSHKKWKRFSDTIRVKAEVRCWLAWQDEPGLSFGTAINSQVFRHDSANAIAFLKWIYELYKLPELAHLHDRQV